MKSVKQALEIAKEFVSPDDEPCRDVVRLLEVADKKTERLESALEAAVKMLIDIRYQDWPVKGLGVGLNADQMDEVIMEAESALDSSKRKVSKKR
jgi:hypothetical protein